MNIQIDTHIRYKMLDTDWHIDAQIREALTVPNPDYEMARRERLPGWRTMPQRLSLWTQVGRQEDAEMVLPRGFLPRLLKGLSAIGITPTLTDHRIAPEASVGAFLGTLRPDQRQAGKALLANGSGILQAPPGAGKTVTALAVIAEAQTLTLVIVNTTHIAAQWRERSRRFLGVDPGLVGDGVFAVDQFTVALQQTLWSRREELQRDGFFDQWGMVILDECHHAVAETYTEILQRFRATHRFGLSATPERKEGQLALAEAVIGPVVYEAPRKALVQAGVLVTPMVIVMQTGFDYAYRATGHDDNGKFRRNNYTQMMASLVEDEERNRQIAEAIVYECHQGSACLVVSRRLEHLSRLDELVRDIGNVAIENRLMLTGEQDTDRRMEIAYRASKGQCVIFSTIADEAVDIPRLDRLFLAWPTRLTSVVRQQIGRIERSHPDKRDAVVYDCYDVRVNPLRSQFRLRRQNIYDAEGMLVMFQGLASDLRQRRNRAAAY